MTDVPIDDSRNPPVAVQYAKPAAVGVGGASLLGLLVWFGSSFLDIVQGNLEAQADNNRAMQSQMGSMQTQIVALTKEMAGVASSIAAVNQHVKDADQANSSARRELEIRLERAEKLLDDLPGRLADRRWRSDMMVEWALRLERENVERGLKVPDPRDILK